MKRRLLGVAILVLWGAMLASHARREYFQPELARLAEATMALDPGTSFYTLTMGERAVGRASSSLDTLPDGFRLDDLMVLELPALGQTGSAVARTRVELTDALRMRSFDFSLDSEVGAFEARGTVAGDTLLQVDIVSQGATQRVSYRLSQPPIFSSILPIRVAMAGELEVGASVRVPVFDPTTLSTRNVEVRVLERDTLVVPDSAALNPTTQRWEPVSFDSIPAWKIAEIFGGVSVESWIDDDGRTIRASSPLGFSMEKTEYELADQALDRTRRAAAGGGGRALDEDVILSTAIRSNVDLSDAETYRELRFVLSGVDLTGFDLDGGRQELRGDTLVVRREGWAALEPGYELPYPRMDLAAELQPEPLIQSDHPAIVEMADRVSGRMFPWSPDPRGPVRELNRWVHGYLEKTVTFSVPSALQVLETRQGDCNEHTVLFVAMARALGIPTRTAVGLVFVNGAFFYHAWPEVWMGQWVAVDPTFGQAPADAAHIRFVVGGLAQQVEIVRLIGRLRIDVVGLEDAPA